jgi:hypothetical protein
MLALRTKPFCGRIRENLGECFVQHVLSRTQSPFNKALIVSLSLATNLNVAL